MQHNYHHPVTHNVVVRKFVMETSHFLRSPKISLTWVYLSGPCQKLKLGADEGVAFDGDGIKVYRPTYRTIFFSTKKTIQG
jgi:hypothetical protein